MKNILIYLLIFLFIFFAFPMMITKKTLDTISNENQNPENKIYETNEKDNTGKDKEKKENNKDNDNLENKNYKYKKYGSINLLHTKEGNIENIPIDEYLYHVVSAEMPVDFEIEALKAQAIVARTYTIYKIQNKKHNNADICDDSKCCQAWVSKDVRFSRWEENKREENWNKIKKCVEETKGKVITYENKPINAFFHSNSGGKTEIPLNVWGGSGLPYLQVVETAGEEGYKQYLSEVTLRNEEIIEKIKTVYSDIVIDFNNNEDIKILDYTDSGRIRTIKFGNHNLSGVEARKIFSLKSTNFEIIKEKERITFKVKGYGHGVGMSQTGADSLAKQGKKCDEIIKHFYKNIEIKNENEI